LGKTFAKKPGRSQHSLTDWRQSETIARTEVPMNRFETEDELADIRARIARLQAREAFLNTRLNMAEEEMALHRPGWPIRRDYQNGIHT
jgi:hypothetical protein